MTKIPQSGLKMPTPKPRKLSLESASKIRLKAASIIKGDTNSAAGTAY